MGENMDKIELPGGEWAALRDPDTVTERQRKPFIRSLGKAGAAGGMATADDGGLSLVFEMQDALVLALVESWSFELPVTADSLEDLPHKTVTALRVACYAFREALTPDFGPTPDPASPSEPSNA